MFKKRFAVVVGARPNFIKAAPFFREAERHPEFEITLIHTGQHFDKRMSQDFFKELNVRTPDIALEVRGEQHTEKIGLMFDKLKEVFKHHKFDGAVVFGDVNSTLAGALAASKYNTPLAHVEAGLRSHDRRMPEEINRVIVDHLSNWLFTSEPIANENLKREGVKEKKIHYVGNIMIESLELYKEQINQSDILNRLKLGQKKYGVATIHRQENIDHPATLKEIITILNDVNRELAIVWPLHPGTRNKIITLGFERLIKELLILEPVGYFDFVKLVSESRGVITDSGGIQEETTHLGVPCATMRDNTERPITIEMGSNKLFPIGDTSARRILEHLNRADFKPGHIPLWDNRVTERIFSVLEK